MFACFPSLICVLPLFLVVFNRFFGTSLRFTLTIVPKIKEFSISAQEWTSISSKCQINNGFGCETRCKNIFSHLGPLASLQFFHLDLQMETLR